jgi:hypothetical protein
MIQVKVLEQDYICLKKSNNVFSFFVISICLEVVNPIINIETLSMQIIQSYYRKLAS